MTTVPQNIKGDLTNLVFGAIKASDEMLDPKRYGVIVESGGRRGLLLPDLAGVDTVAEQLSIACRKGGIDPNGPVKLWRFEVVRHH